MRRAVGDDGPARPIVRARARVEGGVPLLAGRSLRFTATAADQHAAPVDFTTRRTTFRRLPHADVARGGEPPASGRHFGKLRADTYGPARGCESGFDARLNDAGVPLRGQCRPTGSP